MHARIKTCCRIEDAEAEPSRERLASGGGLEKGASLKGFASRCAQRLELSQLILEGFSKVFEGFRWIWCSATVAGLEIYPFPVLVWRQERVDWLRGFHKLPWRDEESVLRDNTHETHTCHMAILLFNLKVNLNRYTIIYSLKAQPGNDER